MDIMELREYLRPKMPNNGYDGTGSFKEKLDLYDIGTMGISTLKYAKYGIWGTYLGTPIWKRGVFFFTWLPGPGEII